MMKINLREALNKIDLYTDNRYDLRNIYDSANIPIEEKKGLAKLINNGASAKVLYENLDSIYNGNGLINNRQTLNESVGNGALDKPTCENCGTRLTDGGYCPKCDDGEEDYEDLEEAIQPDKYKTFVELEAFRRDWKANKLTDDDLSELQNLIMTNPKAADSLGAGVYKIRFIPSRINRGKSSLYRVFYIELIKSDKIYLAAVLNKSKEANISNQELEILKQIANKNKSDKEQ